MKEIPMKEILRDATDARRSPALWALTMSLALGTAACGDASRTPTEDNPSGGSGSGDGDAAGGSDSGDGDAAGGTDSGGGDAAGGTDSGGGDAAGGSDSGGGDAAGGTGGNDNQGDGGGAPTDPSSCADSGGICVSLGTCQEQAGTVAEAADDCHFDDGVAECCVPPDVQPDGTTCAELGGICTSIGGCLQSGGNPALPEIACEGGVGAVCCTAHDVCGDANIECCSAGVHYRPACDNGEFVCPVGEPCPP